MKTAGKAKISEMKRRPNVQPSPRQLFLKVELAGCMYIEEYETKRASVGLDSKLSLKREPENRYDSYAISVRTQGGVHLGYIPRGVNRRLADEMDRGELKFSVEVSKDDEGTGALVVEVYSFAKPSKKKELEKAKPFIESCAALGFSKSEILILRTLSWPELKTPYLPLPPTDKPWEREAGMFYRWGESDDFHTKTLCHNLLLKSLVDTEMISCFGGGLPKLFDIEHILGNKRTFRGQKCFRETLGRIAPFEKTIRSLGYGKSYYNGRDGVIKKKSFADFLRIAPAKRPQEGYSSIKDWYYGAGRKTLFALFDSLSLFFLEYWHDDGAKTLLAWYEGRNLSAIVAFEYLLQVYSDRHARKG